jgi:peptidoglycan/LPS O-acetylase OafA/YrhL
VSDALTARPALPREAELAPAAAPAARKPFYIPSLDGIRAVSFLIVFVSHAGLGHIVPGGLGVTIFFFLSGYLITTLLRMEYDKSDGVDFKQFYVRRALRIFPPFYLILAIATGLTALGVLEGELNPLAVLSQLFYLNNYYVVATGSFDGFAPGTGIYWSLAVEEHFYMVFPFVYLLLRRLVPGGGRQALVLGAMCVAVLAWRCVLVYGLGSAPDRTYVATDARIDSILFGCILAVYANPMLDKVQISPRRTLLLWVPLGLALLLFTLVYRDDGFRETFRYTLQGLAFFPLFIAAIRFPEWPLFSWLNIGWVRFWGVLSYSLYLVHQVVLALVEQYVPLPLIAQGALALALSFGAAYLSYRAVEKPLARMRRRLLKDA